MTYVQKFYLLYNERFDRKQPKVLLKNKKEILLEQFLKIKTKKIRGFRAYCSKNIIKLPFKNSAKLAYFIGWVLGDGCLRTPIKRKRGGYYWSVEITCEKKWTLLLQKIIYDLFSYKARIKPDKNKKNCWRVNVDSIIIFRFLNRILGLNYGKKSGNLPWLVEFTSDKKIFKNFLAGIMDSDGYRGKYLALIQQDKKFLEKIKIKSKELLDIEFTGPRVNRKMENKIVGWWILIYRKEEMKEFINKVPSRYYDVQTMPG